MAHNALTYTPCPMPMMINAHARNNTVVHTYEHAYEHAYNALTHTMRSMHAHARNNKNMHAAITCVCKKQRLLLQHITHTSHHTCRTKYARMQHTTRIIVTHHTHTYIYVCTYKK